MKEKWAVIIWDYGRHCDEFVVQEVRGPLTFDEATAIGIDIMSSAEHHVTLAPMKLEDLKCDCGRTLTTGLCPVCDNDE